MENHSAPTAVSATSAVSPGAVKLVRRADWRERLAAFLERRRDCPFRWGVNDCALLACDAVEVMTLPPPGAASGQAGVDPGLWLRGEYDSALGAARALRRWLEERGIERLGSAPMDGLLAEAASRMALHYGAPRIATAEAGAGDVCLVRVATLIVDTVPEMILAGRLSNLRVSLAMGIIGLMGEVVCAGPAGLAYLPERECVLRAWRIG